MNRDLNMYYVQYNLESIEMIYSLDFNPLYIPHSPRYPTEKSKRGGAPPN